MISGQSSVVSSVPDQTGVVLVFLFEFYYHDFDGVFACVYVGVLGAGRICGEPVGMAVSHA